jgi:hypothetical protein
MEGTSDRESARLSRGIPRNRSWRPSREGCDRSARGARARFASEGRERPRIRTARTPKWEARREARFSPVSSASAGPEPSGALHRASTSRATGGVGARKTKDVRVDEHGAARRRDESGCPSAPREMREEAVTALGKRRSTGARVERFRSAEVDRTPRSVATPAKRLQAPHGHARPSAQESGAPRQGPRDESA